MANPPVHTKAHEKPAWWWNQLQIARKVYADVTRQKGHFRDQLHGALDLQLPTMVIGYDPHTYANDGGHVEQVNIHYLARYAEWVQSQAFDQHPEILYPRYASPDTTLGDMVGEVLVRVGDDCDEMEEWRGTIPDACANGVFAVWYGIDEDIPTRESLFEASKTVPDLIEEAVAGVHEAKAGQDHAAFAQVAQDQTMGDGSPGDEHRVNAQRLSPDGDETADRLLDAAVDHAEQAQKDEKTPYLAWLRNRVWCQRAPVGVKTLWDPFCTDIRDARWIARELIMDIDEAREHPAFRPRARSKIQSGVYRPDEALQSHRHSHSGHPYGAWGDDQIHAYKTAIWEIWDRKYKKRHYITRGLDEFLEKSDDYPYVDAHGKPLFKNFFPVVIEAPRKSANITPYAPYGIPIMAIAWEMERLIVKLQSYNLDAVKKLSVRQFTYASEMDENEIQQIASGMTGVGLKEPAGWSERAGGRAPVNPINFGNVPAELFHEVKHAEQKLAALLAWPISQMTGAPQADTATAEHISVQAGQNAIGAFIRTLEDAYARGQEIKRALVKEFYTDQQIADLVGQDKVEQWQVWKVSSLSGDRLQARFRILEDPVRTKQIGDVIAAVPTWREQISGLPLVPASEYLRLIQEYVRRQGLGKIEGAEYTELAIRAALNQQSGGNGQPSGETPDKQSERDEKPASNQQISGAVQRVGPKQGAGHGMMNPT